MHNKLDERVALVITVTRFDDAILNIADGIGTRSENGLSSVKREMLQVSCDARASKRDVLLLLLLSFVGNGEGRERGRGEGGNPRHDVSTKEASDDLVPGGTSI